MAVYFFTEVDKLDGIQGAADAYGPDDTNPTTEWHTTSKFQITSKAKAFACVSGALIVQQSAADPSLVNIILKPYFNIDNMDTGYFIYRGIEKAGLIHTVTNPTTNQPEDKIIPQASTNNDLVRNYWLLDSQLDPQDGNPSAIGYSSTPTDTEKVTGALHLNNPHARTAFVKAGSWIGDFVDSTTHDIGFEVVVKTNDFEPTFGYVRAADHTIEVTTGLSAAQEAARREGILSFMDPAAFYGRMIRTGVKYFETSGGNLTRYTTSSNASSTRFIYTKLVSKFHTRNRVYIDIRGDLGHSYNAYGNYNSGQANDIRYALGGSGPLTGHPYATQSWPILYFETAQTTTGSNNRLRFRLRIDDNTTPIFYLPNIRDYWNNTGSGSRFTRGMVPTGNNGGWAKMLSFQFRNVGSGSSRHSIANHIKAYYFRRKMVANADYDNRLPREEHYYHNAFISIDTPALGSGNVGPYDSVSNPNPVYIKEPINHANGLGGYEVVMKQEAYWDSSKILLTTTMTYENGQTKSGKEFYPYIYPEELPLTNITYRGAFPNAAQNNESLNSRLKILCRKFHSGTNELRIPSINLFKSFEGASAKYSKENCLLMGLTHGELNAIKAVTGLDTNHERYIYLEPAATNFEFTENRGPAGSQYRVRYFKFLVRVQGIGSGTNTFTVQTPQMGGQDMYVYTRDGQFFSSKAFGADIPVSMRNRYPNETGTGKVELEHYIAFHIYQNAGGNTLTGTLNNCADNHRLIKISDNLDFALMVPDNQDQDCHSTTQATTFDNKQVFYFWHAADNTVTQVGNFHLVVADRVKRSGNLNGSGAGWTQIADYTNCNGTNYRQNYGVDADGAHRQNNTRHISSTGTKGWRSYKAETKQKIFMIRMVNNEQNILTNSTFQRNNTNEITYQGTLRFYANPAIAAAVMGALFETTAIVESGGFAFADGSCYPSSTHVNGEAFDTDYLTAINDEKDFIRRLHCYGFQRVIVGKTSLSANGATLSYNGYSGTPRLNDNTLPSGLTIITDPPSYSLHHNHLHADTYDYWELDDVELDL
ncbi:MAG TPA: hypothetical protein DCE41_36395 [Cytophagales bacterium]|nr:hypothetical protein [Cytophagales bacterium]HAA23621.1 hypothetical protein [Cytophagales bacterium]HAP64525.1 hypothetical protein [Cytophagales bacterium]